jgi:Secretion system C-terminal sorting domain
LAFGPDNDVYIADAAANAIVKRDHSTGAFSIFATFPNIPNSTGIGGPTSEAVPTGIVYRDHKFFIGSLTGFPFGDNASTLYELDTAGNVAAYKTGLTTIVDVTTDPEDSLILLQHAAFQLPPPPFAPNTGAVLRINQGIIDTIFYGLNRPTSVRFKSDSELYVSTLTDGKIVRIVKAGIPTNHMRLWLKGDAGVVLDGSRVTKWMDQSGEGNDAVESDTSRQPIIVNNALNGYPVMRFDGVNDRLGFTGSERMTHISLFMVFNNESGGSGPNPPGFVLTFGPGGTYVANEHFAIKMRGMDNGDNDIIVGTEDHGDYTKATGQGIAVYNEWRNINITRDSTVWNTTLRWNGINAPISTAGSNLPISVPLGDSAASGGGIGSTDNFPDLGTVLAKCDIAEIVVYDIVLSDTDRLSVEKYLSDKYHVALTGINDHQTKGIPESFRLYQNYPNPFNPTTVIAYDVAEPSRVTLVVYDILGRRVATLVDSERQPGEYQATFDGSKLSSGIYFYRFQAGNFALVKKLMIVK